MYLRKDDPSVNIPEQNATDPTLHGVRHVQALERVMRLRNELYQDDLAENLPQIIH